MDIGKQKTVTEDTSAWEGRDNQGVDCIDDDFDNIANQNTTSEAYDDQYNQTNNAEENNTAEKEYESEGEGGSEGDLEIDEEEEVEAEGGLEDEPEDDDADQEDEDDVEAEFEEVDVQAAQGKFRQMYFMTHAVHFLVFRHLKAADAHRTDIRKLRRLNSDNSKRLL